MQANLVFSPFAKPRTRLGIALLKSYVEKNSNSQIECFDLNAGYHNDLCADIRNNNGRMNSSPDKLILNLKKEVTPLPATVDTQRMSQRMLQV